MQACLVCLNLSSRYFPRRQVSPAAEIPAMSALPSLLLFSAQTRPECLGSIHLQQRFLQLFSTVSSHYSDTSSHMWPPSINIG
ncbi:hypothetical protein Bca52824_091688 [Brassica carinata]|uniref:Uncharacterized protein n=1 Tax=Brassica carinata TaxID=52824 RepID=A0A8X7NWF7_BRACI|nr:hypothetical protein Bca52824_091688 [Brassica carinata]